MKSVSNGIKGIFGGFIFILIGICLLWFNEGNNVKNIKAIDEGRKVAVDIANSPIDNKNEDKLVNINGDINIISGEIKDDEFNIVADTAKLVRKVEVYQWEEKQDEDSNDNTTYSYKKVWSDDLIDSSDFNESSTHQNPSVFAYQNTVFLADEVKIGDFEISESQKNMFIAKKEIANLENAKIPTGYNASSKYITNVVETPKIGDVRISFLYNNSKKASIIGKQQGDMLYSYKTKSGKNINMLKDGVYSASEMLDEIETQNIILKWVLRVVGYLLVIAGFAALFRPIEILARYVPFLGGIVGAVSSVLALFLGAAVATITVAISWIVFRPILGIGLLVVAGGLIYVFIKYVKKKKTVNNNPVPNSTPVETQVESTNNTAPVETQVESTNNTTPPSENINQNNNSNI